MPREPRTKEQRRIAAEQRRLAKIAEEEREVAAERMAWKALITKYSPPKWVLQNSSTSFYQKSEDRWRWSLFLFKKIILKEGYYWERNSHGSKTMVSIHPDTGEKAIVIIYDVPNEDWVQIFQAEVNATTREVTFTQETILANLDPNDFELYYE